MIQCRSCQAQVIPTAAGYCPACREPVAGSPISSSVAQALAQTPAKIIAEESRPVRSSWKATCFFALVGAVVAFLATRNGFVLRSDDGDRVVSFEKVPGDDGNFSAKVAEKWTGENRFKNVEIPASSGGVWIGPSLGHWSVIEIRRSGRQAWDLAGRLARLSWGFIGLTAAAYALGFGLLVRRRLWHRFTNRGFTLGFVATIVLYMVAASLLPKEPLDGSVTLLRFNGLTLAALGMPLLVIYSQATLDFLEGRRGLFAGVCRFLIQAAITIYLFVGVLGWIAAFVVRILAS